MANGRYTYTLDVENARALKKLAEFTKASDKATQRVNKDLKKQLAGNIKLKKSLERLTKQYERGQKAAIKSRSAGVIDPRVIESQRKLKNRIRETTQEIEKGKRAAIGYRNELGKINNRVAPPGPAAPRRGFGGNVGRRAGFSRGAAGRFASTGLGGAVAGGMGAAAGGLVVAGAVAGVAALTAATIAYGNAAAIAATKQSKFQKALVGVLGDETTLGLDIIKDTVDKFNVPLQSATENFTRLAASTRAAGVSTEDAKAVFQGMVVANKALGGSNEQLNGILLATQQVFSKGKVTAEELRGQIGERLPGAVSLFASSMGKTTAELDKALEQGTVSVADFVKFSKELFEEFGDSALKISQGPEEAGARLDKAMNELMLNVGKLLAPVGAEFQDAFTEIAKVINIATLALLRFYNVGLDNKLNKAIMERTAAQAALTAFGDSETRDLGRGPGGRIILNRKDAQARLDAATTNAADLQKRFNASIGKGQAGMKEGSLLTTADMLSNRGGSGAGSGANAAANAARALAKVQAAEVRKLADLELKLLSENNKHRMSLVQQSFTGEKAAQIGILNTYLMQNEALDVRAKKFLADVERAESELAAAQARLDASSGGADAIKAQGGVDIAQAKLMGAQGRADAFNQNLPNLQGANVLQSMFATTQPFRDTTANLTQQIDLLRQKNRLVMEGFSGPALEAEMQKVQLDQLALEKISAINEEKAAGNLLDAEAAKKIRGIAEANDAAKAAVDGLTEAQRQNSGALQEYISSAQDYMSDVQGRMAEIAGTIEQSISSAVMGLVNGTMTATQAFHNFFKSVGEAFLKMASQMIAKMIIIKLLKSAIGLFGGGGDSPNELNIDGVAQYVTTPFANGGIVTGPTNALIGEGGMNEAVVPLPNGRSIPVDMGKSGGAGNVQTNITVNVDQGGQTDTQTSGDNANKLGKAIDSAVKRVIMDERRVGGLLYSGRR